MYIYKITNNLNNKIYIGLKTSTVEESESYYGSGIAINQAIKKYGKDNFTKTILERDITDWEYLKERERHYIEYYDSFHGDGYNLNEGGMGSRGTTYIRSDEHRQKMSQIIKNTEIVLTDEAREKMRLGTIKRNKAAKGKPLSDSLKRAIGKASSNAHKNSPILTCPHCNKQGKKSTGLMTRYHFDNCKHKIVNNY